jgi:hypothetical protein
LSVRVQEEATGDSKTHCQPTDNFFDGIHDSVFVFFRAFLPGLESPCHPESGGAPSTPPFQATTSKRRLSQKHTGTRDCSRIEVNFVSFFLQIANDHWTWF